MNDKQREFRERLANIGSDLAGEFDKLMDDDKPVSKHKKGERFEGEVAILDQGILPSPRFVYTGEKRIPARGEWFVCSTGTAMIDDTPLNDATNHPCEILTLVPDEPVKKEPEFHVGDLVWWDGKEHIGADIIGDAPQIVILEEIRGGNISPANHNYAIKTLSGKTYYVNIHAIRHLTPAEWVNTVTGKDGKEYRARLYYEKDGCIMIADGDERWSDEGEPCGFNNAILVANCIIKPYAQTVRDHGSDPENWPAPEPL